MSKIINHKHACIILSIFSCSFYLACNNHRAGEKTDSRVSKSESKEEDQKSKKIDEEQAKELVLQSYKKIFSSLFFLNDIDKTYFHPPMVRKDELRASLSAPSSWRITNFPTAGTYFEARVDRNSGAVEWIQMGYASE